VEPEYATPAVQPVSQPIVRVIHETVHAQISSAVMLADREPIPASASMGQPIAEALAPKPPVPDVVHALDRSEPSVPPAQPPQATTAPARTEPLAIAALSPEIPAATTIPVVNAPEREAPPKPDERTSAPASNAEPLRDESADVREILERYESAYSALDAGAAHEVWPFVNQHALARAFAGLASQHVSLGRCDVNVTGPSARATCSGTATWAPKVGGGTRTESRRWTFELQKQDTSWRIRRALVQ
jgi:hypothetical protein